MSEFNPDNSTDETLPQSDRLQILSPEEYELLWGFPRFTQSDRDLFFTLTVPERKVVEQRRSIRTKIHLLLHLGYFRARQRFFRFDLSAVRDDVDYLRRRYFDNVAVADLTVSLHTRQRHIELILGLFRYRSCALNERAMLQSHARHAVRVSSQPVYVLRELVDLLRRERVVLPGYTYLQDLVREALALERRRLAGALEGLMSAEQAKSIDRLLADDAGLHQITTIKRQPRDFTYQQLRREIERGQQLQALFALAELLYEFGYRFAPRYRNVQRQVENGLLGFHHPTHYDKHWPIKPNRRVREGLILSEEANIERILLSLALKSTTQSVIIGKLSAYQRKNRTKRALWELDSIVRTLYLLDYIDLPVLRRNVQKALNRGEAYHQLRRAIAYAHGGRFRVKSQHEQELWNECARLIGNAVVYYNALILSESLAELELRGDLVSAEVIKRVSPVAWQHINFYGRYQFDENFTPIDLDQLRQQLSTEEVSRLYATG